MGTRTDDLATVASRVKYAREAAGLSQRQLSKAAGLSNQTISNIEAGHFGTRITTLEALAKALNVSLGWLLEGKGEPPSREVAAP